MDHHCPWVNNCIGHCNYGHFIRFLFFVDVACSYHMLMLVRRTIDAMNARYWVCLSHPTQLVSGLTLDDRRDLIQWSLYL